MKERKKRGGPAQLGLTLGMLYGLILLAPAAVYGASGQAPQKSEPFPISAAESAPPETPLPESSRESAPGQEQQEDRFPLRDASTGETLSLTAAELLPGAVACEMDPAAPKEALKAQAVAAYTMFCEKRASGEEIVCSSADWQTWTTEAAMKERWGGSFDERLSALKDAVSQVEGQLLTYEGEPILCPYFAISAGSTETAGNVWQGDRPYLQAVASPGDLLSDGYLSTAALTEEEFRAAAASLGAELVGSPEGWLEVTERSPSGYVTRALLGGKEVRGTEVRSAFSLRSACFETAYRDGVFTFTVRGWGHGVGMSQAGAVFLAKRGAGYEEILAHYYPGAVLTAQK